MQECNCSKGYLSSSTDNYYIRDYYSESKLYPPLSNRENMIITAETTLEYFEKYCSSKGLKPFDKQSVDSIVAVAMAAKMGNVALIDSLVRKIGTDILNTCDRNYFTPLHIACHETCVEGGIYDIEQICRGVQRLIHHGANPNIPSSESFTPLSTSALRADNIILTDLLIQNGGRLTSCVSHLKHSVEGKGFISAEPIIKENIENAQKARLQYIYS